MKSSASVSAIVLVLAVGSVVSPITQAGPTRHRSEKILQQDEEERYVIVTGSHIPQRIKLKSIGTETPYNLRIYGRRELESTGRFTVGQALSLDPSIGLSGTH